MYSSYPNLDKNSYNSLVLCIMSSIQIRIILISVHMYIVDLVFLSLTVRIREFILFVQTYIIK